MIFGIIMLFLFIFFIIGFVIYQVYKNFVKKHSILLQNLQKVNEKYHFNYIEPFNFVMNIDNESYYKNVYPFDYLVYQLQYCQ